MPNSNAEPVFFCFNRDARAKFESINLSVAVMCRYYRAACNADAV